MNQKFASLGILAVFVMMLVLLICIIAAHAQTAIIGPNGAITYVYPGTNTQPSIVVQPNGGYSYVYPMGPSTPPPVYVHPGVPDPLPSMLITPPTFAPPLYGGY
jgi:hypothetical protein